MQPSRAGMLICLQALVSTRTPLVAPLGRPEREARFRNRFQLRLLFISQ